MKIFTAIILKWLTGFTRALIIGVLLLMQFSCAKNTGLADLTCVVSSIEQGECPSIPTLQKGVLNLQQDGGFELTGNYASCYHSANVRILGQYQHSTTPKRIIEIELAADNITQDQGKKIEFPRTIGFINLDNTTLEGNYIDIWSNIRTKGLVKQETIAKKLQCKSS